MNKYITLMLLLMGNLVFSQVGIATQTPHASSDLELGAADRALYLNRVADPENDVADPQPGMMLYDTTEHCVKVFGGDPAKWSDCLGGVTEPPTNPPGTGSLSGRTCFDVVEQFVSDECGTIASRLPQKADFSQTETNTQTYTFTPSGTVSNVRFVYMNTNGQVIQSLTGGNTGNNISTPVTATVKYYDNLNAAATGLSRDVALLADIYVIYNDSADNTGTDLQLQLTARVQDCSCCGAYIAPGVWKNFMCHNLGADITADPFTPSWKLNGAYIQWGKRGPNLTGDSSIDWQTAPSNGPLGFGAAPTASDPNSGVISGWAGMDYSSNAWNSGTPIAPVKTAKDPCPNGFRVPTDTELDGLIRNNTITYKGTLNNSPTNYEYGIMFGDNLYIPVAGRRNNNGSGPGSAGILGARGNSIHVWTSTSGNYYTGGTTYNNQGYALKTAASNSTTNISGLEVAARGPWGGIGKDYGYSIRCIAE